MDGGKKPRAKTESKERNFWFSHFWFGRISQKIGSDRKKWKKFLPPTHAVLRSKVGRPLSALERGIAERLGAFLLSLEPLRRNSNRNFREISRGNFELRRILSFSFRSGISRSEIEKNSQPRTTKGFDSVRVGTRITTNDDVSLESFSNSSNRSVFFRSEKAEDF